MRVDSAQVHGGYKVSFNTLVRARWLSSYWSGYLPARGWPHHAVRVVVSPMHPAALPPSRSIAVLASAHVLRNERVSTT